MRTPHAESLLALRTGSSPASRRSFLRRAVVAGAFTASVGGVTAALTGCGSDDDAAARAAPQLAALFSPSFVLAAGIDQRIPFGLIDNGLPASRETGVFPVRIAKSGETVFTGEVEGRIVAHDHPSGNGGEAHQHANLLRYFALRVMLDEPGIYDLILTVDDAEATLPFQVFSAAEVQVPLPGQPFPAVRFPTFEDPLGMDPICTRFGGPCQLHEVDIESALSAGPVALLIATPALCQTAYCGPVLEVLLELAPDFPTISFLHADVYENAKEVSNNYLDERIRFSPTVTDLNLQFEPTLFLLDPDRTIVDRIDNVYDNTELAEALTALAR